ncbi:MAG TPA: STN domain-containing protein, partial [Chitinophagaceae bacterium]|nr:STN domain-containing protein [Chitinophagaceae bacterium]
MKCLTALLVITALMMVVAGKAQTVTYKGKDVSLEKIFKVIKKQTGYSVMYNAGQMQQAKPVTVNVTNSPLESFLNEILRNQPFTYTIENTSIFIAQKKNRIDVSNSQSSSPIDVRGRVVNENGEPLEGVTVAAKGTNSITATD